MRKYKATRNTIALQLYWPCLPEFESFAKKTYQKLGFPNTTAVSNEFGFGVFGRNKTVNPPVKYHDTSGETPTYDSPYKIIAPIFRTDEGSHPVLLFNVHSQPFTGDAIDQLINCSDIREKKYRQSIDAEIQSNKEYNSTSTILTMPPDRCGVITDIFENVKLGGLSSVAHFLPIYPTQNPLTGKNRHNHLIVVFQFDSISDSIRFIILSFFTHIFAFT